MGKRLLVFESGNSTSYEALVYGVDEDELTLLVNANAITEGNFKSDSFRINYVLDHTGITNMIGDQSITVYPNTSDGILNVSFEGTNGNLLTVKVFTLYGYVLHAEEFPGSNNIILDLSHLKNGLYLLSTIESPAYAF